MAEKNVILKDGADTLYPKTLLSLVDGMPQPTSADNGKMLGVDNGEYALVEGGGGKYLHNVWCGQSSVIRACFQIATDNSTPFSSWSDIRTAIINEGHTSLGKALTVTGYAFSQNKLVWGVFANSNNQQIDFVYDSGSNLPITAFNEIHDDVVAL